MLKKWCLLLLCGCVFADGLAERLRQSLTSGEEPPFSDLEMALIAGGADDADTLAKTAADYEALIKKLSLSNKQLKQSPARRQALTLKNVVTHLRKLKPGEAQDGLLELLNQGRYNALTAAYLYIDLAKRAGLEGKIYGKAEKGFSPYFLNGSDASARELAAALFVKRGLAVDDGQAAEALTALRVAKLLAPDSAYGAGDADARLYNRVFKLYEAGDLTAAAQFAAGAAERYPNLKELQPLCYNIAVKMFQAAEAGGDRGQASEWGETLAPHTGELRKDLEAALATLRFNGAVNLYNQGELAAALEALAQSGIPPEEDGARNLRIGAYEQLAEQALAAGDGPGARGWVDKLAAVDAERADYMNQRLSQLSLKKAEESGDLTGALELAAKDLSTDLGRNNYLAVLSQYVQSLYGQGKAKQALAALDRAPEAVAGASALTDLRVNSYTAWLASFSNRDYRGLIPVYRSIFADKRLDLKADERDAYLEGYGNALYFEIEDLIAERQFQTADKKSKQALAIAPNHEGLKSLRKKVDVILKRIED